MLQAIPIRERIAMCVRASSIFESDDLPLGSVVQSSNEYTAMLAQISGLSHTLVRQNTGRISKALRDTGDVVNGLSRGMPLDIFDDGFGEQGGAPVRIVPKINGLGVQMPNNSPGVNVTWFASLAFGIPVLIRPGSSEPLTPYRAIQAFIKAGFPAEVFGYYPCDYAAADRIPYITDGSIVFGSDATVKKWSGIPGVTVHVHGSGWSKVIVGEDMIEDWQNMIPELTQCVTANSGRSCFTASRLIVPRYGRKIALAIAAEASKLKPGPLEDPETLLSAMAMPNVAEMVNDRIDAELAKGGAEDMSASHNCGGRLVKYEGRTYLLPTIVLCDSNAHPLANEEFLFPFAAVVEASNDVALTELGSTLALSVYSDDRALVERARRSNVRLVNHNVPTSRLDRRQPHEHDQFSLFYRRLSWSSEG